jgi:predicted RNA-binding Zn ribbon-like protein
MSDGNGNALLSPLRRDLALELANTLSGRREGARDGAGEGANEDANEDANGTDLIDSPAALGRWLEGRCLGDVGEGVLLRLPEFRALRAAIRDLLTAASAGEPLPRDAVDAVNRASAAVPSSPALVVSDTGASGVAERTAACSPTARILAAVARWAIAVIVEDGVRVRRCPAPRCDRFFIAGRAGQVWCSAACGNRARVARHHARRRTAPAPPTPVEHPPAPA